VVVGRFFPTSKTCSVCGDIHSSLKRSDRPCACAACGTEHDGDINAAKNILREGLRLLDEGTDPEGHTRRRRGTEAREEDTCAVGRTLAVGQPTSLNREPGYRAAQPRPTRQRRDGRAIQAGGGEDSKTARTAPSICHPGVTNRGTCPLLLTGRREAIGDTFCQNFCQKGIISAEIYPSNVLERGLDGQRGT